MNHERWINEVAFSADDKDCDGFQRLSRQFFIIQNKENEVGLNSDMISPSPNRANFV